MKALLAAALKSNLFAPGFALMAMGTVIASLRRLPERIGTSLRRTFYISVDVRERDIMHAMEIWLASQAKTYRRITACFHWRGSSIGSENKPPTVILSPGRGAHLLLFERRLLFVARGVEEVKVISDGTRGEYFTIGTWGRDPAILRKLMDLVAAEYVASKKDYCRVYVTEWSDWCATEPALARRPESVILKAGQLEEIRNDLLAFRRRGAWYADRGIPYRRGYLLHGPPGTGKSSLVRALTADLEMSLYVLNLGSHTLSDERLEKLLAKVAPGAAILVEDVDCAAPHRSGEATKEGDATGALTLSGLLNALDGILSSEGRVLFMTTNRPEVLDEALIRPGRVDLRLHLGLADQDQARRLFLRFFPDESNLADRFSEAVLSDAFSPAELQGLLLKHAEDPIAAVRQAEQISGVRPAMSVA